MGTPGSELQKIAAWRSATRSINDDLHLPSTEKPRRRRSSISTTYKENILVADGPITLSPATSTRMSLKRENTRFPSVLRTTPQSAAIHRRMSENQASTAYASKNTDVGNMELEDHIVKSGSKDTHMEKTKECDRNSETTTEHSRIEEGDADDRFSYRIGYASRNFQTKHALQKSNMKYRHLNTSTGDLADLQSAVAALKSSSVLNSGLPQKVSKAKSIYSIDNEITKSTNLQDRKESKIAVNHAILNDIKGSNSSNASSRQHEYKYLADDSCIPSHCCPYLENYNSSEKELKENDADKNISDSVEDDIVRPKVSEGSSEPATGEFNSSLITAKASDGNADILSSYNSEDRRPTATTPFSPTQTEYDGDDVIMGEATPAMKATILQHEIHQDANKGSGKLDTVTSEKSCQDGYSVSTSTMQRKKEEAIGSSNDYQLERNLQDSTKATQEHEVKQHTSYMSPSDSGAASSHSGVSTNPLFAGTPSHPTPPSITTMRSMSHAMDGKDIQSHLKNRSSAVVGTNPGSRNDMFTPLSGNVQQNGENVSPIRTGMKLAEQLHNVAENLQTPGSAQNSDDNVLLLGTTSNQAEGSAGKGVNAQKCKRNDEQDTFITDKVKDLKKISNEVDGDLTFQFKDDVAALLQALDNQTPEANQTKSNNLSSRKKENKSPSTASTAERSTMRRTSSPRDTSVLDLSKFNENGDKNFITGTPILNLTIGEQKRAYIPSTPLEKRFHKVTSPVIDKPKVLAMKDRITQLEQEREQANGLLSSYQNSISELQDLHSTAVIQLETENSKLKKERNRILEERKNLSKQFETLYNDKYLVLKAENASLRRGADSLHSQLMDAQSKAQRVKDLEIQLDVTKATMKDAQNALDAARKEGQQANQRATAALDAAKETEKRWVEKMERETKRNSDILAAKDAEVSSLRKKCEVIAKQLDEALHKYKTEHAKIERSKAELSRKEDEICALEVDNEKIKNVLAQYKSENQKFYETKKSMQQRISALESENNAMNKALMAKEEENMKLRRLLNESMDALEQERAQSH